MGVGVYGQTIKSLGYNTTNGQVIANTTNTLTFTNIIEFHPNNTDSVKVFISDNNVSVFSGAAGENILTLPADDVPVFSGNYYWNDPSIRAAFGFSTNLNTLWTADTISSFRTNLGLGWSALTNTNAANFRTAIQLGATNDVFFSIVRGGAQTNHQIHLDNAEFYGAWTFLEEVDFDAPAETRTNLGLGWSALTNTNAATSLLGYGTNGQIVYNNTNTLTFTNRVYQSSTNTTNVPELRLTTKSNNVASWFVYDAVQTNPAAPDWAVAWLGLNTVPNGTGTDRALLNQSIGGASFTIENMWVSPVPDPDAPVAEFYFNITDTNNLTTRGFSVVGNQTNSTLGFASFTYPLIITYNSNSRYWYGGDNVGLNVVSTNTGELATFTHSTTNLSGTAQIYLKVQNNQTIWQAGLNSTYLRNFGSGRNVFRAETNGVIYGAVGSGDLPLAPVHLAGNTRIDGSISFNATTNADITRTNLGLGSGITTNRTFVSYDGTNYTTNSVTISNGIITGWTQ